MKSHVKRCLINAEGELLEAYRVMVIYKMNNGALREDILTQIKNVIFKLSEIREAVTEELEEEYGVY